MSGGGAGNHLGSGRAHRGLSQAATKTPASASVETDTVPAWQPAAELDPPPDQPTVLASSNDKGMTNRETRELPIGGGQHDSNRASRDGRSEPNAQS
jgi:hypothetical protein